MAEDRQLELELSLWLVVINPGIENQSHEGVEEREVHASRSWHVLAAGLPSPDPHLLAAHV
jgi:hypothetical protein